MVRNGRKCEWLSVWRVQLISGVPKKGVKKDFL